MKKKIVLIVVTYLLNKDSHFTYVEPKEDITYNKIIDQMKENDAYQYSDNFHIDMQDEEIPWLNNVNDFNKKKEMKEKYMTFLTSLADCLQGERLHAVKKPDNVLIYDFYARKLIQQVDDTGIFCMYIPLEYPEHAESDAPYKELMIIKIYIDKENRCYIVPYYETEGLHADIYLYNIENIEVIEKIKELTMDFAKELKNYILKS